MTARKVTMVVGMPCTGKSTIFRNILARSKDWLPFSHPFYHHRTTSAAILGRYDEPRQQFPGTDRLSMSVAPKVREWIDAEIIPWHVLFEGDRLGNFKMASHLIEKGYDFKLVVIRTAPSILRTRREAERVQRDAFVKGQATKIANLMKMVSPSLVVVKTNNTPEDVNNIATWLLETRCG